MADFSALIAQIEAYVKQNGNNEITGNGLQSILVGMVNAIGDALNDAVADLQDEDTELTNSIGSEADAREAADNIIGELIATINAKIPSEASSSNKLADKAFVTTLTDALQSAIDTINANIGNGYVYVGVATPSGTPVSGKVVYLTAQAGTYTNYGGLVVPTGISVLKYNGTTWSQEQVMSMADIYRNPLMGLFDCSTAGATDAKVVTADGYVLPTNGGSMKVRMANHTTVDNVTLNINGTGAKTLYYKGKAAGINNTWGDGAILNVMYDSTNSIYLAYDANAGTGDGVFDISDYTGDTYEDLVAALADVPVSERHGGMMVRFIQGSAPSVDNKYVQYRYMGTDVTTAATFTNVANWQGVDKEPVDNSRNLIESGAVAEIKKAREAAVGYYECNTAAANGSKTVAATGYVLPTTGGCVKVKFAYRNTAGIVTLNIGGTGEKPLYYNGKAANASNTWDNDETVEVYYDGTNYQAHNVAGGSGDGVFDISKYNATGGTLATYADLAAALGTNGANVPEQYRSGGMSVKFVRSSDNKYVQYRLMATTWSTAQADWQGVDKELVNGSHNLAESGAVYNLTGDLSKLNTVKKNSLVNAINEIAPHNTVEDGFYICDRNGNVLIRLDVLDSMNGLGENLMSYIINQITPLIPETVIKATDKGGFYICNENGEAIAVFKDDQWTLLNTVEKKKTGGVIKRGSLASGDTWILQRNSVKHGNHIMFSGKITSFDTITIGHGTMSNNGGSWIQIDDTNLYVHYHNLGSGEADGFPKTYAHGLTIKDNIQVEIIKNNTNTAKVVITSGGSRYETASEVAWYGSTQFYVSSTSVLTKCSFGWTSKQIYTDVWLFGDSYFSLNDPNRWTTYLFDEGYTNFMLDGKSGEGSAEAFSELTGLLEIYTPKMIVWCLGMNNPDTDDVVNSTWKSVVDSLMEVCQERNIELVLSTIPTVVGGWNPDTQSNNLGIHKYKNAIVRESGYRYIDFDSAVGANENTGEWFNNGETDDMLENYGQQAGRIHPTSYGAKALYYQAISDCPELTR